MKAFTTTKSFRATAPTRMLMRAIKKFPHVVTHLGDGVKINPDCMSRDAIAYPKDINSEVKIECTIKPENLPPALLLVSFFIAFGPTNRLDLTDKRKRFESKKLNFYSWIKAEAVRVSYPNQDAPVSHRILTREDVIKRVANKYGASHPIGGDDGDQKNSIDSYIDFLMRFTCYGYPLPYFILFRIATEILENLPPILEKLDHIEPT